MSFYTPFIPGSEYVTNGLISTFNSNTLGNLFTTNGNVGINTTTPIVTLDVSGEARITGTTSIGTLVGSLVSAASMNSSNTTTSNLNVTTSLNVPYSGTSLQVPGGGFATNNLIGINFQSRLTGFGPDFAYASTFMSRQSF